MTTLSHEIDLLHFLVGDITEARALLSSARRGFDIEDTASMALRFANGALGSMLISDAGASPWFFESGRCENPAIAGPGEDYLGFAGTYCALAFPSLTQWSGASAGEIEWSTPRKRQTHAAFGKVDPIDAQMTRFARVVNGGDDDVLCTPQDGAKALAITLATALSGRRGNTVRADEVPGRFTGV